MPSLLNHLPIYCRHKQTLTSLRWASYVGWQHDTARICCRSPCCGPCSNRSISPIRRAHSSKPAARCCSRWVDQTDGRTLYRFIDPATHTIVPVTGSQKVAPRCSKTVQTHTSLSRRTACCAASLLTTSLCIAQDAVYCYHCSVVIGATAPWIRGTRPLQLLRVIFSLGNVGSKPDLLAKLTGRSKEDKGRKWVKHGCSDNGRRGGRTEEEK